MEPERGHPGTPACTAKPPDLSLLDAIDESSERRRLLLWIQRRQCIRRCSGEPSVELRSNQATLRCANARGIYLLPIYALDPNPSFTTARRRSPEPHGDD